MAKTIASVDIELSKIFYDEKNNRDIGVEKQSDDKKAKMSIDTLAENIKEHGLLFPIILYPLTDTENSQFEYGIIAGGRRFKAYEMLARDDSKYVQIPAIIREIHSEDEKKYIQLSENISRKDLTEEEKAVEVYALYQKLQQGESGNKTGYGTVARKLGISRSYVKKLCDIQKGKNKEDVAQPAHNKIDIDDIRNVFTFATTVVNAIKDINECDVDAKIQIKSEAKFLRSKIQDVLSLIREAEKTIADDEEVKKKEQADKELHKQQKKEAEKVKRKAEKQKNKAMIINFSDIKEK